MIDQVTAPVLWQQSVRLLVDHGTDSFIEVGPGKVLCGLIKRIDPHVHVYALNGLAALKKLPVFLRDAGHLL